MANLEKSTIWKIDPELEHFSDADLWALLGRKDRYLLDKHGNPVPRFRLRKPLNDLKRLAAMTPEQRRAALGASAVPLDANGRRTLPQLAAPMGRDLPDDAGHGLKPGPTPFVRPQQPTPQQPARPSYARPQHRLDHGERVGEGGDVPPGRYSMIERE